eukprot:sb/3467760/
MVTEEGIEDNNALAAESNKLSGGSKEFKAEFLGQLVDCRSFLCRALSLEVDTRKRELLQTVVEAATNQVVQLERIVNGKRRKTTSSSEMKDDSGGGGPGGEDGGGGAVTEAISGTIQTKGTHTFDSVVGLDHAKQVTLLGEARKRLAGTVSVTDPDYTKKHTTESNKLSGGSKEFKAEFLGQLVDCRSFLCRALSLEVDTRKRELLQTVVEAATNQVVQLERIVNGKRRKTTSSSEMKDDSGGGGPGGEDGGGGAVTEAISGTIQTKGTHTFDSVVGLDHAKQV